MNIVKMFHMMPLFLVGLAFASVSVFILYTAVQGGDPDFYCVGICFGIPFGLAGLAMLSGAIQGIRTEVETYVVLEQHVEYGTDPLNNAQSERGSPARQLCKHLAQMTPAARALPMILKSPHLPPLAMRQQRQAT